MVAAPGTQPWSPMITSPGKEPPGHETVRLHETWGQWLPVRLENSQHCSGSSSMYGEKSSVCHRQCPHSATLLHLGSNITTCVFFKRIFKGLC